MSKDIRSFFTKVGRSPDKKPSESGLSNIKKRSHKIIESDDEDNDLDSAKKLHLDKKNNSKTQNLRKKPEIIVEVEKFFGKSPVSQKKAAPNKVKDVSKTKTSSKAEAKSASEEPKKKKAKNSEVSFELDDELDASLLLTNDEELTSKILSSDESENQSKKSTKKKNFKEETIKSNSNKGKFTTPEKPSHSGKKSVTKEQTGSTENSSSEKKRKNAEAYQKYLNRKGPQHHGAKEIPKGSPTCLQGLAFVITGVLDSLEREEAVELIQNCGGRVVSQVSKKTDFVVVGDEPGLTKIQKADNFGTKKISEDELLDLIREKTNSGENNVAAEVNKKLLKKFEKTQHSNKVQNEEIKKEKKLEKTEIEKSIERDDNFETDMLLVDKYKPKSTKNIVGQNGERSNVKKLIYWLQNWHKNHSNKGKKKPNRPAPWSQTDDGSYYKAALLSGPPGVGKTTTVHLVCKELGFDMIEFNASDTRSKRLLQEEISELLSSKSIRGYFQGEEKAYKKHVLVMDEVDGMAGNEDRGGIQELIQLIKNTKIPIVGICNDRNHMKMRTLVNYCFDLRFQKPRLEQIKGAMKSICFKENIDISGEALEELIVGSSHDLRQILHHLSMLASSNNKVTIEEAKKKCEQAKKPLNLSPWDVVRKVFSAAEQEKMNFFEKSDLFFQDYSLGPLFVQETYLRVKPHKAKGDDKKKLELISKTADSLTMGDVFENNIRRQNAWGLLPLQAVFSSVLPGFYMSGHIGAQIQFPAWLGKNSKRNKFDRLLQDLQSSLKISVSGNKDSINLDYLHYLKDSIVRPLAEKGSEGVQEALKFMLEYQLTKEDLDHILELSSWPEIKDAFLEVDPKVKASLTRALNKECQLVTHKAKKLGKTKREDDLYLEEEDEEEAENEDDNLEFDPMIKKGNAKRANKEPTAPKGKKKKTEK